MMAFLGLACFTLAAVVLWASVIQALRLRARERREAQEASRQARVARRKKARAIVRRTPCTACGARLPMEEMSDYGKGGDGEPLFLCPDCQALFERKKK